MGYGAPFHPVASTRLAEVWLGWRTPFRTRTSFDEALTLSRSLQSGKFCLAVRAVDEAPAGPVDSALHLPSVAVIQSALPERDNPRAEGER